MQALSRMIGRKASLGGFLSPPSNPRAQPWTGGGNYRAGVRTLPGLDMPRIFLKEKSALVKWCTGGAWLSSARATAGDKPEEGEDDVKSACPLRPGRHTCYNGRDKGSRPREGKLTSKTWPQFGLRATTRLHEAGIASNRRSAIRR
ncbi:unnamed protein product [Sphagnum compactum]